jgi:hypothetical protein
MADTATSLADVLKEAWTSNRLQKQFEDAAEPLKRIQKVQATQIGKQAQVPILEFSALNQAGGKNAQAVIASKDLAIESAMSEVGKQCVRQLVTNGDGIVAQCDSGGASATVELVASPSGTYYGFDAIQRGWLHVNGIYDIGASTDTDSLVAGTTLTGIKEDSTDPDIIQGTSITTTKDTHYVYIANPNSGTLANTETNGLRNIVNTSGALGGLNPATAGEEFWSAASRDTTTTVFSLDLALNLQRSVLQKSGKYFTDVWTGYKQPVWASDIEGSGGRTRWAQNATNFVDAIFHAYQIGVQRRNTQAGATGLTA